MADAIMNAARTQKWCLRSDRRLFNPSSSRSIPPRRL